MSADVCFLAGNASFDEFVALFQRGDAVRDSGDGQTLLHRSLTARGVNAVTCPDSLEDIAAKGFTTLMRLRRP